MNFWSIHKDIKIHWTTCESRRGRDREKYLTNQLTVLAFCTIDRRCFGEVAEWLMAAVLKTAGSKGLGGSNPPLSVGQQQAG